MVILTGMQFFKGASSVSSQYFGGTQQSVIEFSNSQHPKFESLLLVKHFLFPHSKSKLSTNEKEMDP